MRTTHYELRLYSTVQHSTVHIRQFFPSNDLRISLPLPPAHPAPGAQASQINATATLKQARRGKRFAPLSDATVARPGVADHRSGQAAKHPLAPIAPMTALDRRVLALACTSLIEVRGPVNGSDSAGRCALDCVWSAKM